MTTSGTYTFDPSFADFIIEAFERAGIKSNLITASHMQSARMSANLLLQAWSNKGVNLWAVDLQSVAMVEDDPDYALDSATVSILDAYIRTGTTPNFTDYPMSPLGRTDYANISNKLATGRPTQYWFNRGVTPTLTVWMVPDASSTYTLYYYRMRRLQDVAVGGGETVDLQYRFFEAFVSDLAARLAQKYNKDVWKDLRADAEAQWQAARAEDREMADLFIKPDLSGYYV